MSKARTLLIDADPVVYRCGFASEIHSYHLVYENDVGTIDEVNFEPGGDKTAGELMKQWLADQPEGTVVLEKTKNVTAQPLEFALEATRTQMQNIIEEIGAKHVKIFLSGDTNYRYALAKQRPYKGNRTADKPVHYGAIRQYLSDRWGAEVVDKIEADDQLSILARSPDLSGRAVIATIDKDLDQIPGAHYNYMKKVSYDIDPIEAELFFYQQCISGDATDNIPGCYKMGAVKAQRLVYDTYAATSNFADVWLAVVQAYAESKERNGCPYLEADVRDIALETARLVKLQEYPNQLWTPPGAKLETVTEALYGI